VRSLSQRLFNDSVRLSTERTLIHEWSKQVRVNNEMEMCTFHPEISHRSIELLKKVRRDSNCSTRDAGRISSGKENSCKPKIFTFKPDIKRLGAKKESKLKD
jgi:hypothetical protein